MLPLKILKNDNGQVVKYICQNNVPAFSNEILK